MTLEIDDNVKMNREVFPLDSRLDMSSGTVEEELY